MKLKVHADQNQHNIMRNFENSKKKLYKTLIKKSNYAIHKSDKKP